ncbi:MAG: HAMP domain-containing protein [Sandaracinobacter sp.]
MSRPLLPKPPANRPPPVLSQWAECSSLSCLPSWWAAARRFVVRPVEQLNITVSATMVGNLTVALAEPARAAEIGQLGRVVDLFRRQLLDARETAERVRKEQTDLICTSIGSALAQLAEGNVTARVSADLTRGFARLKLDLNAAMTELCRLIGEIASVAISVRQGSAEIGTLASNANRFQVAAWGAPAAGSVFFPWCRRGPGRLGSCKCAGPKGRSTRGPMRRDPLIAVQIIELQRNGSTSLVYEGRWTALPRPGEPVSIARRKHWRGVEALHVVDYSGQHQMADVFFEAGSAER